MNIFDIESVTDTSAQQKSGEGCGSMERESSSENGSKDHQALRTADARVEATTQSPIKRRLKRKRKFDAVEVL